MGFQVSPGVNVTEIDLTTIVPAVSTTAAGIAGVFQWGPVGERTLVDSVNTLKERFQGPDNDTFEYFFTAANFLGYGNNLQVVRVVDETTALNAADDGTGELIKNETDFDTKTGANLTGNFFAKYPGTLGNALGVHVFDGVNNGTVGVTIGTSSGGATLGTTVGVGSSSISISLGAAASGITAQVGDILRLPTGQNVTIKNAIDGATVANITPVISQQIIAGDAGGVTLESRYAAIFGTSDPTTADVESAGGTNDLINVAVVDETGLWTGTPKTVLETFEGLSKASDAKKFTGENNFFKDVINNTSEYIWVENDSLVTTNTKANRTFGNITPNTKLTSALGAEFTLSGGTATASLDETFLYSNGYSLFEDAETVDVSLILGGPASATVQSLLVDLCETRKDCMAFFSPRPSSDFVNKEEATATSNAVTFVNETLNRSSSYAVMDSGYKYMFDTFNGVFRYVPLNGDVAGLLARTERENEAWFSPAGFNRGQIRGVVKLAFNPRQAHRDTLYKNNVNPVVSFPGEGTVLFGDKTLQRKPSAFDRINVRRLFIILEKAIATAAKFQLFEFNDEFTRSQFRNLVVPFLRDVQSRRGINEFKVVCNESNNPGSVIDRNEFVADIFIKPTRSINFIQLNFIATASGVSFEEVGG